MARQERCLEWVGTAGTEVARVERDVDAEIQFAACWCNRTVTIIDIVRFLFLHWLLN